MDLSKTLWMLEAVDVTGPWSCPMTGFGDSAVKTSIYAITIISVITVNIL